jgi:hypothetical protein
MSGVQIHVIDIIRNCRGIMAVQRKRTMKEGKKYVVYSY